MSNKSRILSIRISREEYDEIKTRCNDIGEMKVSDFVRAAMMGAMAGSSTNGQSSFLDFKLASLHSRVARLEEKLAEVTTQMLVGKTSR